MSESQGQNLDRGSGLLPEGIERERFLAFAAQVFAEEEQKEQRAAAPLKYLFVMVVGRDAIGDLDEVITDREVIEHAKDVVIRPKVPKGDGQNGLRPFVDSYLDFYQVLCRSIIVTRLGFSEDLNLVMKEFKRRNPGKNVNREGRYPYDFLRCVEDFDVGCELDDDVVANYRNMAQSGNSIYEEQSLMRHAIEKGKKYNYKVKREYLIGYMRDGLTALEKVFFQSLGDSVV